MGLKTIYKYPLDDTDRTIIKLPKEHSILSAGVDPSTGWLAIWAAVLPEGEQRDVEIVVVGTGRPLPHVGDFIGTVQIGPYVWHVFTGPADSANRPAGQSFHFQTSGNS